MKLKYPVLLITALDILTLFMLIGLTIIPRLLYNNNYPIMSALVAVVLGGQSFLNSYLSFKILLLQKLEENKQELK